MLIYTYQLAHLITIKKQRQRRLIDTYGLMHSSTYVRIYFNSCLFTYLSIYLLIYFSSYLFVCFSISYRTKCREVERQMPKYIPHCFLIYLTKQMKAERWTDRYMFAYLPIYLPCYLISKDRQRG